MPARFSDVKYVDTNFNLMLYSKIVDFLECDNKKFKKLIKKKNIKTNFSIIKSIVLKIFKFFSYIFSNQIVINNLGIKSKKYIQISYKIKQFPFFWINPNYVEQEINLEKRKKFFSSIKKEKNKNFENFFDNIVCYLLPKSYLEDFQEINSAIETSYWPKNCKKIITAYEYKLNDIFKIWVAKMTNHEAKYFLIQHGGAFGSHEYLIEEDINKSVADKFLTWGWSDKLDKKTRPFNAFQFNLINQKKLKKKINKKNKILVCYHFQSKFSSKVSSIGKTNHDRLYKLYQLKELTNNIRKKSDIVVRYSKQTSKMFNVRFDENIFHNQISFDYTNKLLTDVLNDFKLVIHDNDTTTFLTSMYFNIPTILILNPKFETFRVSARKIYKNLERNNIIFYDPASAAKFINKNEKNFEKWWYSKKLQNLREKFCKKFVRYSDKPVQDLLNQI